MKKFLLLTTIPVLLFSCKKEDPKNPDPVVTPSALDAHYKFSTNYKDETGKSTATTFGTTSFTTDRKGNAASALLLDGGSKLTIDNVFQKGVSSSISVWIAKNELNTPIQYFLVSGSGYSFAQSGQKISGVISHGPTSSAQTECPDLDWHHYVLMFNGVDIKVYKDGTLAATTNHPGTIGDGLKTVVLGFHNGVYWKGKIDDLKFYSKLLTDAEILALSKE